MRLGTRIKELREGKDWSLRELARMTEINVGYLSRLESGKQTNPTIDTLNRLSKVLEEELYFYTRPEVTISLKEVFRHKVVFGGRKIMEEEKERILQGIESTSQE